MKSIEVEKSGDGDESLRTHVAASNALTELQASSFALKFSIA